MEFNKLIRILLLLAVVSTSTPILAQITCLKDLNLKGKVKKVVSNEYPVDETVGKKRKAEYTFDAKGRKVSEIIYDDAGNWLYKDKLEYNKDGYLITESSSNKITFHVDMVKRYTYDKNNRLTRTQLYNCFKHLISIVTYTYNAKGLLVQTVNVNDVGTELERTSYAYDDNNRLVEERELDPQRALVSYSRYEYNEEGRKTSKSDFDKNGFKEFTSEYTYDMYGNIESESSSYTGGTSTLIEYRYDYGRNHNWTRLREIMNGRTFAITTRDIEFIN